MRKITAKDIAAAAEVSLATVDRVLNNRGGVSEKKERRVLEWARRLKIDRALNQRPSRTLRIAVLLQSPDNPFHAAVQRGFEAAALKAFQYNLQFKVHHIDPTRPDATAKLILRLTDNCDGMAIVSAQDDRVAAAMRLFAAAGKPIVTMATDMRQTDRSAYVGPDNGRAGRIAGDLMGRLLGKDGGDIVIISGMVSMLGHGEREAGFRAVMRERFPACRITEVLESRERAELAGDLVFSALKHNGRIRGIYNASTGALPVVNAIRVSEKQGKVVFITHELTADRRQLLREGLIDVIIDQNPSYEVQVAVEVLAHHLGRKDDAPVSLITPIHIHTIENC